MINASELKALCRPALPDKAYFRPFICKGNLKNVDIFLVGINPATPIFPSKDIGLDEYAELILDYEKFIAYYKQTRIAKGKTEFSRTRTGINSFINWLTNNTSSSILETNVIPYPTAKYRLLKKEPPEIIDKAKAIFFEIMVKFQPSLIILHGKPSLDHFLDILANNELMANTDDFRLKIEEAEEKVPFFTFSYPTGKKATVVACRHFMYYGENGDSFSNFRNKLKLILTHIC